MNSISLSLITFAWLVWHGGRHWNRSRSHRISETVRWRRQWHQFNVMLDLWPLIGVACLWHIKTQRSTQHHDFAKEKLSVLCRKRCFVYFSCGALDNILKLVELMYSNGTECVFTCTYRAFRRYWWHGQHCWAVDLMMRPIACHWSNHVNIEMSATEPIECRHLNTA